MTAEEKQLRQQLKEAYRKIATLKRQIDADYESMLPAPRVSFTVSEGVSPISFVKYIYFRGGLAHLSVISTPHLARIVNDPRRFAQASRIIGRKIGRVLAGQMLQAFREGGT